VSAVEPARGWGLRPYEVGDERQLVELFAEVFGRPLEVEAWRWKLKGRRSPVENVWVATSDDDGRVIGQYAGIPIRLRLAGAERWAMQSVDTMVSPRFRRRGILTELGKATYASWARGGVAAVFGVPNQNWGTRTDALGLEPLFRLAWLRVPLHAGRAVARAWRAPRPLAAPLAALVDAGAAAWRAAARGFGRRTADLRVEPVGSGGADFDALWRRAASHLASGVVRDAEWVEWRYLRAPGFGYTVQLARSAGEPAGYVAYRLATTGDRRTGIIADLFVAPGAPGVAGALLSSALADLLARGAETAQAAAPRDSWLHRTLRRAGFLARRDTSQVLLAPLSPEVDPASLRSSERWHLAAGDFDVV
jgi:hypothetical protein